MKKKLFKLLPILTLLFALILIVTPTTTKIPKPLEFISTLSDDVTNDYENF